MHDEWEIERLDVPAYLNRIGYDGPLDDSLATLALLHRAHVTALPFENIDVRLGREIRLDLGSIQDKLIRRRRGGYCYEHNLLFAALLERTGFTVTRVAARVRMGERKIKPRTHMALLVKTAGRTWLADTGFGGQGLLAPVPLREGADTRHDAWRYGVIRDGREWVLRAYRPDGWLELYALSEEAQHQVDFDLANHFISTSPRSPFVNRLTIQRVLPDRRLEFTDGTFKVVTADGTSSRAARLGELLGEFGIALTTEELRGLE